MRVTFIKIFLVLRYISQFLTANLYGILILVILLYLLLPKFTGINPLSFNELLLFIMGLSPEYKVAILTSTLTIVGFLIAFQTATASWQRQKHTEMRLQAAIDFDITYSRINELITAIKIFADLNMDLINKIGKNLPEFEIISVFNYLQSQHNEFLTNRKELSLLHTRSYLFYGRYSNVLSSTWNSFNQLEHVNEALRLVAEKMWLFIPQLAVTSPNYKELYMQYSNVTKLEDLSNQCGESHEYIAAVIGNIKGKLTAPIFQFNLSALIMIFQKSKWIEHACSIMKTKKYRLKK